MPTTSPDNLYYPDDQTQIAPLQTILANMQNSTQNALTQVRADAQPYIVNDSGWTLSGLNANSPAFTGVTDSQGRTSSIKGGVRQWGPVVELRFRVTKGTGTITASSSGNINDATVATITNTAYRPAGTKYFQFDYGPGLGSGAGSVKTDGTIVISDFYPNGKIEPGNQLQIDAMYFVG